MRAVNFSAIFCKKSKNAKRFLDFLRKKSQKNLQLEIDIFFFREKNSCKTLFTAIISIIIFRNEKGGLKKREKKENSEKRQANYNVWGCSRLVHFPDPSGPGNSVRTFCDFFRIFRDFFWGPGPRSKKN